MQHRAKRDILPNEDAFSSPFVGLPRATKKSVLIATLRYRACRAASEFAIEMFDKCYPNPHPFSSPFSGWCSALLKTKGRSFSRKRPFVFQYSNWTQYRDPVMLLFVMSRLICFVIPASCIHWRSASMHRSSIPRGGGAPHPRAFGRAFTPKDCRTPDCGEWANHSARLKSTSHMSPSASARAAAFPS